MSETACLRRSLSQPCGGLREAKESDPLRALRESVSFGRFMTEPLEWERWSVFSHNRYLEEAERFSKPGSVAQKKAYFEAQLKKKAAQRAVTLVEASSEEISANDVADSSEFENKACKDSGLDKEGTFMDEQRDGSDDFKLGNAEEEVMIQASNDVESFDLSDKSIDRIKITSEDGSMSPKGQAKMLSKTSSPEILQSSAKPTARVKRFTKDSVDKRSVKLIHMSIHVPSRVDQSRKISSPIMQKIKGLRNIATSFSVSKNSSASLQTKPKASVNGLSKIPSLNLKSEGKSSRTMLNKSVLGGITTDQKLKSLSAENSKSSDGLRNKPRSSVVSSPFSFKSEERAAKRKEFYQKLEERRNTDEAQNKNLQTRNKTASVQPKPLALARKATPNQAPKANARPLENTKSKSLKNDQNKYRADTSQSQMNTHENTSPNIRKSASK